MKRIFLDLKFMLVFGALIALASPAYADKVESIQKTMKRECNVGVNSKTALTLIRPLFLTCVPGTKVQLEKCDVSCLKANGGMVLGRQ